MDRSQKLFNMIFADIYPLYLQKVAKKGRTQEELDFVLMWLTGYDAEGLQRQLDSKVTLQAFFDNAPQINPAAKSIKGIICGIRIEDIQDSLMQKIRWIDKLVDDLAKGKNIADTYKL